MRPAVRTVFDRIRECLHSPSCGIEGFLFFVLVLVLVLAATTAVFEDEDEDEEGKNRFRSGLSTNKSGMERWNVGVSELCSPMTPVLQLSIP